MSETSRSLESKIAVQTSMFARKATISCMSSNSFSFSFSYIFSSSSVAQAGCISPSPPKCYGFMLRKIIRLGP
jgi:hypothetical protein